MNPEAQERLDAILKKEPESLNTEERQFLRARASYLKKSQLEEYKGVLEAEETPEEVKEDDKVPYDELLAQVKALGYTGRRLSRAKLEDIIRQRNPFN